MLSDFTYLDSDRILCDSIHVKCPEKANVYRKEKVD